MERKKMNKLLVLVLVVVVTMMVGSAHATDWNFYGSARVQTFIEKNDSGNSAGSFTEYEQYLQTNSRIGARVKVNEQLTGRFEYGASSGNANIRLLY
jgi:hypothetical protein